MPDNSKKFDADIHIEIPEWVNEHYFKKVLRKEMEHFVKILKFSIIAATPAGENYSSLMLRVLMDIELDDGYIQQKSYVMKTLVDNRKSGQMFNALNMFPKEKLMYETFIPQLEKLYEELNMKVKFAPRSRWIESDASRITLVLEDLQVKKFKNINRLRGFDMPHMKRILRKLAEFHAASVILQDRNGPLPDEFHRSYLPANYCKSKSYQARVASYRAAMTTWGLQNYGKYAAAIPSAEEFVNGIMTCLNTDVNEFKVLNHGDFWSNNIMLNYTPTGAVNQLLFVDYQLCKWNSPAQDLWQLIICSADNDIRIREFDNFIRIYHIHLVKCLNLFNYVKPIPTLRDLHISMLKYGFWGFFTTFTHLVFVLLPPNQEFSLMKMLELDEEAETFRLRAFTNPLYVRAVLDIFPFLYNRGILAS